MRKNQDFRMKMRIIRSPTKNLIELEAIHFQLEK